MLVNDVDEIVKQNHYGARCWLNSKDVCQEIGCTGCRVFLDAVSNAVKKIQESQEWMHQVAHTC